MSRSDAWTLAVILALGLLSLGFLGWLGGQGSPC